MWRDLKDFFRDPFNQNMLLVLAGAVLLSFALALLSEWVWPTPP
jgi:E3 ubiquitin-protein ligase DOA10